MGCLMFRLMVNGNVKGAHRKMQRMLKSVYVKNRTKFELFTIESPSNTLETTFVLFLQSPFCWCFFVH